MLSERGLTAESCLEICRPRAYKLLAYNKKPSVILKQERILINISIDADNGILFQ